MLSLPNVSSAQSVVSRPLLVSDAALRATNVARAIEPTTAVSKERSRVEARVPEGLSKASAPPQASPAPVAQQTQQAPQRSAAPQATAPPVPQQSPPGERSMVQKAMDTQIKELFTNAWKASAKAVDFLLGRAEPTPAQVAASAEPMGAIMWSLTAPAGSRFNRADFVSAAPELPTPTADIAPIVYSARGSSAGQTSTSRGALLDVLA